MPLPLIKKTTVVEPLPKWLKVLFTFALVAVVGAAGGSFWLAGQARVTAELLAERNAELARLDGEALEAAKRSAALKNDIQSLKTLLAEHVSALAFFEFLEEITVPQTHWQTAEVAFGDGESVKLRGGAKTFEGVAQEVERLRSAQGITDLIFGRAALGAPGNVDFSLEFTRGAAPGGD